MSRFIVHVGVAVFLALLAMAACPLSAQDAGDNASQLTAGQAFAEFDRAVRMGDVQRSRELLEEFPKLLDKPDRFGRSPLFNAIHAGQAEIIALLLDKDASVTLANADGDTPLHRAAQSGDLPTVKLLFQRNAFVDTRNRRGETPLFKAASEGAVPVAEYLISRGGVVNRSDLFDNTPLHRAALKGHLEMVKLLLRYKADPAAKNVDGQTPADLARKPEIKALLAE
jgi:ankyrin repeat protein